MNEIYKNNEEHNPNKKRKILIVSAYVVADMFTNEKMNPIVNELFIRGRKLNIYLVLLYSLSLPFQKILD